MSVVADHGYITCRVSELHRSAAQEAAELEVGPVRVKGNQYLV